MPRHIWSVLCKRGILDRYTNSVSLIDTVEGFNLTFVQPVPEGQRVTIATAMHLVTLWIRSDRNEPETFEARPVIIMPSGDEVGGHVLTVNLELMFVRTFMKLEAMPFEGPGLYWFAVEYRRAPTDEWARVSSVPLDLMMPGPSLGDLAGQREQMLAEAPAQEPAPVLQSAPTKKRVRKRK